jgi:hypothetical protein
LVTTANNAVAQVRVANPGPAASTVTFKVKLGKFKLAPLSTTIAPYHSAMISVTPNTAIPPAGEASLSMSATQPVNATLATGTTQGVTLSPLAGPVARAVLSDITGGGFAEATATNATRSAVTVAWTLIRHGAPTSSGSTPLGAGGTISLGQLLGGRARLQGSTLILASPTPALVVSAILNSSPAGLTLVPALDGG